MIMYHFPCNVCDVCFESLILHNTYYISTTYMYYVFIYTIFHDFFSFAYDR